MNVLGEIFTATTLFVVLMKVAPLLLAALGGAFTQQGNILNIGLEGMMLIGAFAAISVGSAVGNPWVGVLAAIAAGLLLSVIYAVATLWLKADFIVVGIGVNLLAAGLSVFLLQVIYGNPGTTPSTSTISLPRVSLGPLANIPVIGQALNDLRRSSGSRSCACRWPRSCCTGPGTACTCAPSGRTRRPLRRPASGSRR